MEPTPMMAQWHACKAEAKEALLLFRLGDFYESFYEDAHKISKEIGLTLTARQGIPMCGIPFHTAETYIDRLIAKGFKVSIAEQQAAEEGGLMKRKIVRTVTPGTLVTSQLLSDKRNNFFASISQIHSIYGLAYLDLTTLQFQAVEFETKEALADELCRLKPAEVLASSKFPRELLQEISHRFPFCLTHKEISFEEAQKEVPTTGQVASLLAAGALLSHLKYDLKIDLPPLVPAKGETQFLSIDRATLRHLELIEPLNDGPSHTLLDLLDKTATPMGARLLSDWIQHPLAEKTAILARQDALAALLGKSLPLSEIRDLERLIVKVSLGYATPRDLLGLGKSLAAIAPLRLALAPFDAPLLIQHRSELADLFPLAKKLLSSLNESPPIRLGEGDIFQDGIDPELDRLRLLAKDSLQWIARYQAQLREETGIKTLKVGFTRAFGYYIEVTHAQKEKIPPTFQRRQTLTSGERFLTEELKQFEYQVLSAEEKAKALEAILFESLRKEVALFEQEIRRTARAIAHIDVLLSLSTAAKEHRFVRPEIDTSPTLDIALGRHPTIEQALGRYHFIPNDTHLTPLSSLMLITGPNMAGKSTYLRQTALLVILAQMGSFIPAESAKIGLVDKIFSRIGASDNLAKGQSTFMVEMSETAYILEHATSRSLVLLDEIGRGTSTYDGIALAWSVAETLLKRQTKTLFATHYWELTHLPSALNFHVAIAETPTGIAFLHKLRPGPTYKSYGIHVARLAGLPPATLTRAEEILRHLERTGSKPSSKQEKTKDTQFSFL